MQVRSTMTRRFTHHPQVIIVVAGAPGSSEATPVAPAVSRMAEMDIDIPPSISIRNRGPHPEPRASGAVLGGSEVFLEGEWAGDEEVTVAPGQDFAVHEERG